MFYCIYIYPTLSTCFAFPGLLDTAIGVLGAAEGDAPAMLSPQDAVTAAVPQGPHGGPRGPKNLGFTVGVSRKTWVKTRDTTQD